MAGGADVLERFLPNLSGLKGYLPDPTLQAQLIQNITDAQQDRIKRMGDIQAQGAGAVPRLLADIPTKAFEGAAAGRKLAAEENAGKTRQAQSEAELESTKTANQDAALKHKMAEEQYSFMHQPDPKNTAQTRENAAQQSDYEMLLQKPEFERQHMAQQMKESDTNIAATKASTTGMYQQQKTAAQDIEESRFLKVIDGIVRQNPPGPERDAKIKTASDLAARQGSLPPGIYPQLAASQASNYDAQIRANAAAMPLTTEGQHMTAATQDAIKGAGAVQQLNRQLQDYSSTWNLGPLHSDKAQAAIAGFVGTLRQMGAAGDSQAASLADYVQSANPLNGEAGTKMQSVVQTLANRVQNQWETEGKRQITPGMSQRPEVQNANQAIQSLGQVGKKTKNTMGFGPGNTTVNNKQFTNPGAQNGGQAIAQPAAPSAQQAPMGAGPNGQMVTSPGFNPQPQPMPYGPLNDRENMGGQ
jgi:hypothetical protein